VHGYRFVKQLEVLWRDQDALGHVNNAVYFTYVEAARLDYLREVLGFESFTAVGVIVARVTLDFRSPATVGEVLDVGARVTRLGAKSLDMEHEIRGPDDRLVAEASTVLVAFDYARNQSVQVPANWRHQLESYEARSFVPS
jgi:acyl-CoA thioester hydrolase